MSSLALNGNGATKKTFILGGKVCKYCEDLDKNGCGADIIYDDSWTDRFHLWKDEKGGYRIECYADQSSPIKFCPMCRRNLCEQNS